MPPNKLPDRVISTRLMPTGKHRVRYVEDGRQRDAYFGTEQAARDFAAELTIRLVTGKPMPRGKRGVSVDPPTSPEDWKRLLSLAASRLLEAGGDPGQTARALSTLSDASRGQDKEIRERGQGDMAMADLPTDVLQRLVEEATAELGRRAAMES